ncbi:MAG TPA: cytochrome c biogenesis heme-transporting ATPase CcmA [Gammaproteobacteria bacterium]|nr:cytochrome c biogenesis heme-transporting ATPase CcmA [Gammaproteobacteria bacterium]
MLEVLDLACVRGDRRLFEGLNFSLEAGELLYVHGPNGAGKTTLLRTLSGLVLPEDGEVRWGGENIRRLREDYYREMAYIGHLNGIKDELSTLENLLISAALAGVRDSEDRAFDAIGRLGLKACAELPGKVLSQGQKRRAALARLLLAGARLWIVDEPFNALDVKTVGTVQAVFSEHLDTGGMVVLTTHQEVAITDRSVRHVRLGE